jgi:hypothetical protein
MSKTLEAPPARRPGARVVRGDSFRCRGPIRTNWLCKPHGDRRRYFCSELVMEACVAAGLVDNNRARPAATYPRDLFFGRSTNPFLTPLWKSTMAGWRPHGGIRKSMTQHSRREREAGRIWRCQCAPFPGRLPQKRTPRYKNADCEEL